MPRPAGWVRGRARERRSATAVGVLAAVAVVACSDGTGPAPGFPIEPGGGVVAAFGDSLTLTFPAGAVGSTVRVTIHRVAGAPTGPGLISNTVVDIGPEAAVLSQPATLEMRYDASRLPTGATEADLRLHVWSAGNWKELPGGSTLSLSSRRLVGQITQLGRYAIRQAGAASVQLTDTAHGPITALVDRALVGRAFDVTGVPLSGTELTLSSLDPAVAGAQSGLVVRGASPGVARLVLASGPARDTLALNVVFGWRAISLVSGGNAPFHGCGIGQDDLVYCWGENRHLQGGRPTADSALAPTLVPGLPPVSGAPKIVVGTEATCYSPGIGWMCWGTRRMSGEDVSGSTLPRAATWLPAGEAHIGYNGACITPGGGAAQCWGVSPGDGSPPQSIRWTPQAVQQPGGPWGVVRPGLNVVCGVTAQHRAYCWGPNVWGSSGSGLAPGEYRENVPNPVASTLEFDDVRPGPDFACGLTRDGDVWCWGKNRAGLLGDTIAIPDTPVPVRAPIGALRFPANGSGPTFGVGSLYACGLTSGGLAHCWGRGAEGTLGSGSAAYAFAPVAVAGGHRFRSLVVGGIVACGITGYGAAYCWGFNHQGALGLPAVPLVTAQYSPALLTVP